METSQHDGEHDPRIREIAGRLASLRKARGWTLDDVSLKSGLHRLRVWQAETAKSDPRLSTLLALMKLYAINANELFGDLADEAK